VSTRRGARRALRRAPIVEKTQRLSSHGCISRGKPRSTMELGADGGNDRQRLARLRPCSKNGTPAPEIARNSRSRDVPYQAVSTRCFVFGKSTPDDGRRRSLARIYTQARRPALSWLRGAARCPHSPSAWYRACPTPTAVLARRSAPSTALTQRAPSWGCMGSDSDPLPATESPPFKAGRKTATRPRSRFRLRRERAAFAWPVGATTGAVVAPLSGNSRRPSTG
jgi:hypothetical protein